MSEKQQQERNELTPDEALEKHLGVIIIERAILPCNILKQALCGFLI
jgi:hypothetical protein